MRVGVRMASEFPLVSLQRIAASFHAALRGHELVYLPPDWAWVAPKERAEMAEAFLGQVDVVAGLLDPDLLAARRRLGSAVPFVFFSFGDLAEGAWNLKQFLPELTTRDVLLVNCESEVALAERFLRNACVRVVSFAFDAAAFHPLDDAERRAARARLGYGDDDRVVLYAGRITPEKSVHALLGVFQAVLGRVPNAHLVLAGSTGDDTSLDRFGVETVWFANTFTRLIAGMERPERVRVVASPDARTLRELYNAADVKVNLTLNPDENFGLAQVEAIACGTPIVGTAWGGLKDTVIDGVTGFQVSTVATPTGVKLSWWEAVNRIVALLEDGPARERLRESCRREAARWSQDAFAARVDELVTAAARERAPAEPLRATAFAEEFWSVCDPRWPGAAFRRGPRSEALHRELAAPFTAATAAHVADGEPLALDQVLTLATPVHLNGGASVRPDHVFHPFPVAIPPAHRDAVAAILAAMREEPAATVEHLVGVRLDCMPEAFDALEWMIGAGLVLRSHPVPGWLDPATVGARLAETAFAVADVDRASTDFIVYR